MRNLEKLWPTISITIVAIFALLALTSKSALAFDANVYARAGAGWQMYTGEAGGICQEYTTTETAKDSVGNDITIQKTDDSGYIGWGDAGIWVNPGAKIYLLAGYHYIGCTGVGEEYHGPMLGLMAGQQSYLSIQGIYLGKSPDEEDSEKEKTEIAYQAGIGSRIGGLSVDAFAYVKDKSVTGVLGLTFNF